MRRSLRTLKLFGPNRSKVETLRKEALKLKLKDNPIAFCFYFEACLKYQLKHIAKTTPLILPRQNRPKLTALTVRFPRFYET